MFLSSQKFYFIEKKGLISIFKRVNTEELNCLVRPHFGCKSLPPLMGHQSRSTKEATPLERGQSETRYPGTSRFEMPFAYGYMSPNHLVLQIVGVGLVASSPVQRGRYAQAGPIDFSNLESPWSFVYLINFLP